ncbi:VOC family protein [Aureispira anguillae]|uniref:Glyoxalase/bleomycin resistance/extradiol dioxygenase family protein n=1 Tax=Aureispira anguillae TaxID=2864201 RepID=A0A916DPX6_9BACT|nr:VOC family protein [Aureispira anguillae]BDS10401.1 glyoxalase/bleomycin resistance/extradiol dioxygenase family protein [Aureispira anguillae]
MKLKLVVIRSKDINKLSDFYTKFGITFNKHKHRKGPLHYSSVIDGTVFEIYPLLKNQSEVDSSIRLGFEVENLDALVEQLKLEKIELVQLPQTSEFGRYAVVKDHEGRKIELSERIASF